jgi:hypothetical protein
VVPSLGPGALGAVGIVAPQRARPSRQHSRAAVTRLWSAGMRALGVDPPGIPDEFVIAIGDWAHMEADLLCRSSAPLGRSAALLGSWRSHAARSAGGWLSIASAARGQRDRFMSDPDLALRRSAR